jgi:uncharacterized protein YndB with AHSA1/START domain
MASIAVTTDVGRPPTEVFPYVTDPSRFGEWQRNVISGHMEQNGRPTVGARCLTVRRIGFAARPVTAEVTHVEPPRTWGIHGIDGPIRATVDVTVEPLAGGERSCVTMELDFEGHGIGRILVPLAVRRQARKEMAENVRRLKERLEAD